MHIAIGNLIQTTLYQTRKWVFLNIPKVKCVIDATKIYRTSTNQDPLILICNQKPVLFMNHILTLHKKGIIYHKTFLGSKPCDHIYTHAYIDRWRESC